MTWKRSMVTVTASPNTSRVAWAYASHMSIVTSASSLSSPALLALNHANDRYFVPAFQHIQNPAVGVVNQYAAELPMSFFSDSSSIPSDRIGSKSARGSFRRRSR
jgi:hypothetical protein